MLKERILSGVLFGLPVLAMVFAGGWWMALLVLVVGCITLLEFEHLAARRGHRAFGGFMLLWMLVFVLDNALPEIELLVPSTAILLLLSMVWALVRFRQGTENAFTGFAMTIAGSFYIGWMAAHFVSLRALNDGLFWTLSIVFATWIADSAAYFVGSALGRTPLIRDISPKKTWEGYLGGIVITVGVMAALPLGWQALGAGPEVSPLNGVVIGAIASILGPLGDFGISMLKRYAGAKNASNLIPGHGGFLDRIDALLVVVVLGYYYITLFVL